MGEDNKDIKPHLIAVAGGNIVVTLVNTGTKAINQVNLKGRQKRLNSTPSTTQDRTTLPNLTSPLRTSQITFNSSTATMSPRLCTTWQLSESIFPPHHKANHLVTRSFCLRRWNSTFGKGTMQKPKTEKTNTTKT